MKILRRRIRILPTTILVLALLLPLQLNIISNGIDLVFASAQAKDAEPKKEPAPADKKEDKKADKPEEAKKDETKGEPASAGAAAPGAVDPNKMSVSEMDLLQALSKRREDLDAREKAIGEKAALMEATEKRITGKIEELAVVQKQLEALKAEIQQLVAAHRKEESDKLDSLVKIYETMKPKEAAAIFDELDNAVLLQVLGKMKEAKAAVIMANMNPAKAKTITGLLIEQQKMPAVPE
jgi:flagellar motility protein MotE (MotC chaperone)